VISSRIENGGGGPPSEENRLKEVQRMKKLYFVVLAIGALGAVQIVRNGVAHRRGEAEARKSYDQAVAFAAGEKYEEAIAALEKVQEKYKESKIAADPRTKELRARCEAKFKEQMDRVCAENVRRRQEELERAKAEQARQARLLELRDPMCCCAQLTTMPGHVVEAGEGGVFVSAETAKKIKENPNYLKERPYLGVKGYLVPDTEAVMFYKWKPRSQCKGSVKVVADKYCGK
jgi:hypothetical protein